MSPSMRALVTFLVFAAMLVLIVVQPRRIHEAWWTLLAAAVLLSLGLVTPEHAVAVSLAGKDALLLLLGLLVLSLLIGRSGFFDWAALVCARAARGDGHRLYRNTFVLGALITATLSLDTTAVILTPIVLALVRRLQIRAAPYVVLCALVSNVGSLALPISNLTNIIFAGAFEFTFAQFAGRMLGPQLVALVVLYAMLHREYLSDIPARFDERSLPSPWSTVPNRPYFWTSAAVLVLVLLGYFLAPVARIPVYVVALTGALVLGAAGISLRLVTPSALAHIPWGVFPFVIGLFVAVGALDNLGIVAGASRTLAMMDPSASKLLVTAYGTAFASNVINNLPAALLARAVLLASHARDASPLAALVGADVGPIVMPFGSLATMLVLALARRDGALVPLRHLVGFGARAAFTLLMTTTLALYANVMLLE